MAISSWGTEIPEILEKVPEPVKKKKSDQLNEFYFQVEKSHQLFASFTGSSKLMTNYCDEMCW